MIIRPFRALRPVRDLAPRIASYPYDILDAGEARELARGDEHTFLHVEKPEIDLDPDVDPYDARVYAKGRENLRAMVERGWLVRDERPAYYLYRLVSGEHAQIGIAGIAAVEDYLSDRIRKHEHTRPEKELDRTRHMEALDADAGPILVAYRGIPEMNALVRGASTREPDVDFVAADGIGHSIWVVDDPATCERIESLFGRVPATYIADGHHLAAAAARVARQRREAEASPAGEAADDFVLAVHFPARELRTLGYHRIVRDLNGLDPEAFLDRARAAGFTVKARHRAKRATRRGTFATYLAGEWYLLTAGSEIVPADDPVRSLDASVLDERLLRPILGTGDPRTDRRLDFVGGSRGTDELQRRVDSGDAALAIALYPTPIEDVMKVADAGRVMPPKSTWFEPKLRSGFFIHPLD
jgi:uncharacterized protein (DUF1015 family)